MRRFSGDMFAARNIRFQFNAPSSDLLLRIEQRRHLYLIFKEGVNNVVRHSACSEVEIGLSVQASALVLQVKDNGCGFDSSESGYGNGLSGMRARAAALGGTVEVASSMNGGTTLTLRVPLSRMRSSRWRPFFHADRW
jgi:signal transduction histidine kinase